MSWGYPSNSREYEIHNALAHQQKENKRLSKEKKTKESKQTTEKNSKKK